MSAEMHLYGRRGSLPHATIPHCLSRARQQRSFAGPNRKTPLTQSAVNFLITLQYFYPSTNSQHDQQNPILSTSNTYKTRLDNKDSISFKQIDLKLSINISLINLASLVVQITIFDLPNFYLNFNYFFALFQLG